MFSREIMSDRERERKNEIVKVQKRRKIEREGGRREREQQYIFKGESHR